MGRIDVDFTGFQYGSRHSEEMGILRVSDGSRYGDSLTPPFSDRTASVVGMDGSYYFGTNYSPKSFMLNCAFDHITEAQLRKLRTWFDPKKLEWIIFNELPFKKYLVKPASAADIKYVCFYEKTERIYKGELTVQLVSYYPFARSVHKWLNEYSSSDPILAKIYLNNAEWSAASGMLETGTGYDNGGSAASPTQLKVYNPGDLPAHFILTLTADDAAQLRTIKFFKKNGASTTEISDYRMTFSNGIIVDSADSAVSINTSTKLIEGVDTNNLYNKMLTNGDFHPIPLTFSTDDYYFINCADANGAVLYSVIEYDYLYY